MASKKENDNIRDLCSNTASLGNSIALCMVSFLNTGKREPFHFRQLAKEFLDTCTMIYAVSIGLSESSHQGHSFPPDLIAELAKKTSAVHSDFVQLHHKLNKFLDGERKGGFRKFTSRMSADGDIDKLRLSLGKHRDELKISALMFRWSVGDQLVASSKDAGYTSLAAAIKYKGLPGPSSAPPPAPVEKPAQRPTPSMPTSVPPAIPLPPPPGPLLDKAALITATRRSSSDDTLDALIPSTHSHPSMSLRMKRQSGTGSPMRSPHPPSSTGGAHLDSKTQIDSTADMSFATTPRDDRTYEVDAKEKAMLMARDAGNNSDASSCISNAAEDLPQLPRTTPFGSNAINGPATHNALKMAIKLNKHRRIEHVLSQNASSEDGVDDNNLRIAISKRDPESVRLILQFGTNANRCDEHGFTPLHYATEVPCIKGAKLLLQHGADPNFSPRSDIESPIFMAIRENKIDFVQLYIRYGAKMDAVMANGDALFIHAMSKDTPLALVELMLKGGADPNIKNPRGVSPLFAAIEAGRRDLVNLLLTAGADPNVPGPEHPLWPSTFQPGILQLLLAKGANHKKTPGILELATSINNLESISILLAAGVNPNTKKDGTYTPLCTAIRDNRIEVIRMLLANGADPNLMASEYPVFKCVSHRRAHILPQLVAAGADIHKPKGVLVEAVAYDNKEALFWLLDHGANPNDRYDDDGHHTALTRAIQDNKMDYVDILLANGASPTSRGKEWPVLMAVRHPVILSKLLKHIPDIKKIPKGSMEAAVAANQLESVKLLLEAGVSVEDKTNGVFSPLTTALREHRYEIVKFLLEEAGADPNNVGEHLPLIKAIRRFENNDYRYIDILLEKGADVNKIYCGWNAILQAVDLGDMQMLELLINKTQYPIDLDRVDDETGLTIMELVKDRDWEDAVDVLFKAAGHNASEA